LSGGSSAAFGPGRLTGQSLAGAKGVGGGHHKDGQSHFTNAFHHTLAVENYVVFPSCKATIPSIGGLQKTVKAAFLTAETASLPF